MGNTSAFRSHIARQGMDHYNVYRDRCLELGLTMHERAIPEDEVKRKDGLDAETCDRYVESLFKRPCYKHLLFSQTTIDDFVKPPPKPVEWTPDGLQEAIICFVVETDQVRFNVYLSFHIIIDILAGHFRH